MPNSFLSKLPFGTLKSATLWSFSIVSIIGSLNAYILILDRKYENNKHNCYVLVNGFNIGGTWEKVHIFLYCVIPFILMIVFDALLIRKTFSRKATNNLSDRKKKKYITFSLLFITFSFIIMILPGQICFSFFSNYFVYNDKLNNIISLLDYLSFFNHCSIFFSCFITNKKFRDIVYEKIKMVNCNQTNNGNNKQKYASKITSNNTLRKT